MTDEWDEDDFISSESLSLKHQEKRNCDKNVNTEHENNRDNLEKSTNVCGWGFDNYDDDDNDEQTANTNSDNKNYDTLSNEQNVESNKLLKAYESYLNNKNWITTTKHSSIYEKDPRKHILNWLKNEGIDEGLDLKGEQIGVKKFQAILDLPVEDEVLSFTSEICDSRQLATREVCLNACRLLDECDLLIEDKLQENSELVDKKRKAIDEANKEDDIDLDETLTNTLKRSRGESSQPKNYDTLVKEWNEINANLLSLKVKLARLDFAQPSTKTATSEPQNDKKVMFNKNQEEEEDEEIDPLDAYMSSIETNKNTPKQTLNDKIEKSKIKAQIASLEAEQKSITKLLEIARPKFDINKACPVRK